MKTKTKTFNKMTLPEKRVAIAKDILKQIALQKYKARHFVYANIGVLTQIHLNKKALTAKDRLACNVCAVGSAALSVIRKDNKFDRTVDGMDGHTARLLMDRFFEHEQIQMIEVYFEGWRTDAKQWRSQYTDANSRLIAIWQNIIDNKGTFKP